MIPAKVVNGFFKILIPGITGIKADQPGRSPKLPYYAWSEISNASNGRTHTRYDDDVEFSEVKDLNKTEAIQVELYTATESQAKTKNIPDYKRAQDLADEAVIRIGTFEAKAFLRQNNISVLSWTDLTPITKFMGDNNEQRSTLEFMINNNLNLTEKSYDIDVDTVDVNLTLEGIQ